MLKDIDQVIGNLLEFYDFRDKTIVSVGAGGGQFIAYAREAKQVVAIDHDKNALDALSANIKRLGLSEKFSLIHSDFTDVGIKGDIVFFEFCLHEMSEPRRSINHAFLLASEVMIADHHPESDWAYVADEDVKAQNSWADVEGFSLRYESCFEADQYFENYDELYEKVNVQGENSIRRIEKYKACKHFIIPMKYQFALLER